MEELMQEYSQLADEVLKEEEIKPTPPTKNAPSIPEPAPSSPIPPQLPFADNVDLFADYDEEVVKNDGHL